MCVGVLAYTRMRSFDKESQQAADALSDAQKVCMQQLQLVSSIALLSHSSKAERDAHRQRRLQQQQKRKPQQAATSKGGDAATYSFAPPPYMARDAAPLASACDSSDSRGPSSTFFEAHASAREDAAVIAAAHHVAGHLAADGDPFHHVRRRVAHTSCSVVSTLQRHTLLLLTRVVQVSMHALPSIPAAENLLPRVARCRFVSEFFPRLRGMYSSENSEQDSPDRPSAAPAPAVAAKQKSQIVAVSAAEVRDLTPAEKLKRRMMLALAKTRQRDVQSTHVKAAAVAEEERKAIAVRVQMREVEVLRRIDACRRVHLHTSRSTCVWSNATKGAARNAAAAARVHPTIGGKREKRLCT